MRITGVESTDLFLGTSQRPLQVVRVTVANEGAGRLADPSQTAAVHVTGAGVRQAEAFGVTGMADGQTAAFEVPVEIAVPYQAGSSRRVTVTVESPAGRDSTEADITVAAPGWTMWMVSHFHYDPVWWNTQGQFTEARLTLPDENGILPDVRSAFELVRVHLDKARQDPDYKFVLAEIDYLKPHFDACPEDRQDIRRLMAEGRIEIVGGSYNEPNTNLTNAESTIRNAVYGLGFQRDVLGGDPQSAWMLDAFGFDPGYPGLMAQAGLTSSAWARGPFHQWGPAGAEGGGTKRMQFGSEFEWISPDGSGLLTHYMAHHYGPGWRLHTPPDLETAKKEAYDLFRSLSAASVTQNVMLPVGSDHVIPARWVTDIHRDWGQRYVWPRFVTAIPSEFFAAVRGDADRTGAWITPQTRDMNPVYTGKDVSYIDTKQAQRAIETAVGEAERFAALAWLRGGTFPHAALDQAWRLLAFGAHHDAITGVESDQVYLDLLGCWRQAWELGSTARESAIRQLAGQADAAGQAAAPGQAAGTGQAAGASQAAEQTVAVFNGLARPRSGIARISVRVPDDGTQELEVRDTAGQPVPALAEGVERREDGSLAAVTLTFFAGDVPALGHRTYQAVPAGPAHAAAGWTPLAGTVIENDSYLVTSDPERGGTVTVLDKRTGASVLAGPGNELELQEEYQQHPRHGEGPWHLAPKGPGLVSGSEPAQVRAERCPVGTRLVSTFTLGGIGVTQETVLWTGTGRVEFRTHTDGFSGRDRLLRVRFPADVPGGLPVYQTATAVIGRPFGAVDVDSADHWYTLENPANQWFGVGSTARVVAADGTESAQAIGVAEVVVPDAQDAYRPLARDLVVALAAAGVTATCGQAAGSRYGGVDADSNLPDVRIAVGGPDVNSFSAEALAVAGPGYAKALAADLAAAGSARIWVPPAKSRQEAFGPSADVRGASDLPVLIVAGAGPDELARAVGELAADLSDAVLTANMPADTEGRPVAVPLAGRSVAVFNRGTPSGVVTPEGTLHMALMRSCSGWPSGIWIDGDRRTVPDGSGFAWQHWSHTFEYALASGPGDWRTAGFNADAEDYNQPLVAITGPPTGGTAATGTAAIGTAAIGRAVQEAVSVEPPSVTLSALKPRGNPLARGAAPADEPGGRVLTVRLRETDGRRVSASVRLAGGIAAAWRTDLVEQADGPELPLRDGAAAVEIGPFATVTLAIRPAAAPATVGTATASTATASTGPAIPATAGMGAASTATASPASATEAAGEAARNPVYTRYWLHGTGPAPAGNLPVAVHVSPTRIALREEGDTDTLRVTVAAGAVAASGQLELAAPAGIVVSDPVRVGPGPDGGGLLRYDLAPGQHAAWDLTVRGESAALGGRYFVAARIRDENGQDLEDVAMVGIGERRWPDLDLPPEETFEVLQADYQASAAEADVAILTHELHLAPGERGEVLAKVTNGLGSQLRGEAQLLSPWGTWTMVGSWAQEVRLDPQSDTVLRFGFDAPATARPGTKWWALVKLTYFGRVRYTEAIDIVIA